jgi:hypothetical protein
LVLLLSYLYATRPTRLRRSCWPAPAYTGAEHDTSVTTKALLAERVAWAHARAGELRQTEKALGLVDRLTSSDGPRMPGLVYGLDRDEIEVMAGRCYTELRQPQRAEPLLRAALERYAEDHVRETALYSRWLAEGYVKVRRHRRGRRTGQPLTCARGPGRLLT